MRVHELACRTLGGRAVPAADGFGDRVGAVKALGELGAVLPPPGPCARAVAPDHDGQLRYVRTVRVSDGGPRYPAAPHRQPAEDPRKTGRTGLEPRSGRSRPSAGAPSSPRPRGAGLTRRRRRRARSSSSLGILPQVGVGSRCRARRGSRMPGAGPLTWCRGCPGASVCRRVGGRRGMTICYSVQRS